jgi:hypothetical protein
LSYAGEIRNTCYFDNNATSIAATLIWLIYSLLFWQLLRMNKQLIDMILKQTINQGCPIFNSQVQPGLGQLLQNK